ncbi:MAG TPA: cytochrome C oxidase subunit IV family protein [Bacteroidia bacterium]|jgi:cytochrome c oxidase subunit IV|nr:cytochrome C oxidase subunit IV family protein [Bacteroidia bacterium]
MSEFHDDYPQYEFMAHHSEEEGKLKRRKLWNVFWIMLGVTIVELIIGFNAKKWGLLHDDRTSSFILKIIFIGLTLLKAFYIVYKFMHLGDERKFMKYSIIGPYTIFIIYLVFIIVVEANYSLIHKDKMDNLIIEQKDRLNKEANEGHHGGEHEGGHEEGEHH